MKKAIKAIIDTNIFISALLGGHTCNFIVEYFEKKAFVLIMTEAIIKEIKMALPDKELTNISVEDTERLFKIVSINAEFVKPTTKINACRHPEDNKILEAAVAGKANVIVSGDKDLLALKSSPVPVLTPKEFLKLLQE